MTWEGMINDQVTGEIPITLVTLDHDDLAAPVRLAGNTEDVVSGGLTYSAAGFRLSLPDDVEGQNGAMRFELFDIDMSLLADFREVNAAINAEVSVVLASDPDTIHEGPYSAEIRQINARFGVLSGALTIYPVLDERANATITFSSKDFPGLT